MIHQHFGAMDEMLEHYEEMGRQPPDDIRQLVDGVDFESDDFALKLLTRWLKQYQSVGLWWD